MRQKADPCCWGLFDDEQQPIGWICSHVNDFLFGGEADDERWLEVKKKIKERFKFGNWESKFKQCGVTIEQRDDFSFTLQQNEFLDQVSEILIPKNRFKDVDDKIRKKTIEECTWMSGMACRPSGNGVECTNRTPSLPST